MKFYTNIRKYGNKLLVRGYDSDGVAMKEKVAFRPRLHVTSQEGDWKGFMTNDTLSEVEFEDMESAADFIEKYKEVANFKVYGNKSYEIQYTTRKWTKEVPFVLSKVKVGFIDIETTVEYGFPKPDTCQEEILLITVNDTTFTCRPYEGETKNRVRYFTTEKVMLEQFLLWWKEQNFDIISGWNIETFDIPYLTARIVKVLEDGEKWLKAMSPWSIVRQVKGKDDFGNKFETWDIYGLSVLDYLSLYKKFTYGKQESYSLDFIGEYEVGENKLENPYNTFKEFYTNDYNLFVNYNIKDVDLVRKIDDKMKLIDLAMTVAYHAKVNYDVVFSPVATWDAIIYSYLNNKKIAPPLSGGGKKTHKTEGAYVEEPEVGKIHRWILSIDATSLYPSIMRAWNISPETFLGLMDGVDVDSMFKKLHKLGKGHSLAANGAMYSTAQEGIMSILIADLMKLRKSAKKLMLETMQRQEAGEKGPEIDNLISRNNNLQMAAKILLNSLYGGISNQWFRYFNIESARAITLTGQYIITTVKKRMNDMLNQIFETDGYSYVIYLDTDSVYFNLEPYIRKNGWEDEPAEVNIARLSKFGDDVIQPLVDRVTNEIQKYSGVFQNTISFKQEACADVGFWRAKKNYALRVHRSEGVEYEKPKVKILGMEAVRSSTSSPIRKKLKEAIEIILDEDLDGLRLFCDKFKVEFMKMGVYDIAKTSTCNGLTEYTSAGGGVAKGTPFHVRGAIIFNRNIDKYDLDKKFEKVKEGEKVRVVYLQEPNPIHSHVLSFVDKIPNEFDLMGYVDYEMQFKKAFMEPIYNMCESVGWRYEQIETLEAFFA